MAMRIFVRHCDPNSTGEGLGSHARRTLYPLLQVALHFGWTVIWEYEQQPCWKQNEYRSSYSSECFKMGSWLGFDDDKKLLDDSDNDPKAVVDDYRDRIIMVPLHIDGNDPRFGNLRGMPELIIFVVEDYIRVNGMHKFVGRTEELNNCDDEPVAAPVLITLYGRFEYQDDPSPPVLRWMHQRCLAWKKKKDNKSGTTTSNRDDGNNNDNDDSVHLNIAVHIRVPEETCTQEWKDANSISHILTTLEQVWRQWNVCCLEKDEEEQRQQEHSKQCDGTMPRSRRITVLQLDVFTEDTFTQASEDELKRALCDMGILLLAREEKEDEDSTTITTTSQTQQVLFQIHRQSPLLPCVESMAKSDIFIPASSYLSSMAAFFHTSLIVLPDESTRHDPYFATHLKYQRRYANANDNGEKPTDSHGSHAGVDENAEDAENESTPPKTTATRYFCPIVRVEEEEELRASIRKLLKSKIHRRTQINKTVC